MSLKTCPHFSQKILKNFLKEKSISTKCTETSSHQKPETEQVPLWKCLSCQVTGCSRYSNNQCMQSHFETTKHSICVNIPESQIWCYECDEELHQFCAINIGNESDQIKELRNFVEQIDSHAAKLKMEIISQKKKLQIQLSLEKNTLNSEKLSKSNTLTNEFQKPKLPDRIFGLQNLGNTCFFNSLTQVILNSDLLIEKLKSDLPQLPEDGFIFELIRLFEQTLSGFGVLNPRDLFWKLRKHRSMYSSFGQQDSHECFTHFMDIIEKEYKRNSVVFDLPVFGYLAYQCFCHGCKNEEWFIEENCSLTLGLATEETAQNFDQMKRQIMHAQIPSFGDLKKIRKSAVSKNRNIDKCGFNPEKDELYMDVSSNEALSFDQFGLEFLIDRHFGYNIHQRSASEFRCETCEGNFTENYFASNKFYLLNPPPILVIVLKRFRQTKYSVQKEDKQVPISLELDLTRYLLKTTTKNDNNSLNNNVEISSTLKYSLYGIIEQQGSLSFGHYVSYVKKESGTWYYVSDSHFSKISEKEISENKSAYILFYKKN